MNTAVQQTETQEGDHEQGLDYGFLDPNYDDTATTHPDSDADVEHGDQQGDPQFEQQTQDGANESEEPEGQEQQSGDSQQTKDGESDPEGDDVQVKLKDGTELTLNELESGYMMQRDYTQKTEQLAAERREFDELVGIYQQGYHDLLTKTQALEEYLGQLIPQNVDTSLLSTDPVAYAQQKELIDNANKELDKIRNMRAQNTGIGSQINQQQINAAMQKEHFLLLNAMPKLKDPARHTEFITQTNQTAMEFGFKQEEAEQVFDHRTRTLLHYARLGKLAEKNQANMRNNRGQQPTKINSQGQRRGKHAVTPQGSNAARDRFRRSGDIDDAAAMDFNF